MENEYEYVQQTLAFFKTAPDEVKIRADFHVSCDPNTDAKASLVIIVDSDLGHVQMAQAHAKLVELGFRRDISKESIVYTQPFEVSSGKLVNVRWEVHKDE